MSNLLEYLPPNIVDLQFWLNIFFAIKIDVGGLKISLANVFQSISDFLSNAISVSKPICDFLISHGTFLG